MKKNIAVAGTGYVGLSLAVLLAQNNHVTAVDIVQEKVDKLNMSRLRPHIYTDAENFSYRLDGNNVDIDTENAMLVKNQLMYEGLINSINQEFANLKSVMK